MSPEKPKDKNPRPVWMDNLDAQLESRWKEHCEKTAAENPPPLRPEEFRATEDGGKEVLTGESWENIQKRYEAAGWKLLYRKQKAMSSMEIKAMGGEVLETVYVGAWKIIFSKKGESN